MPQDLMTFQQQFPQLFQQGLTDQQGKKWDDALSKYKILLDQGHNAITNEQASVVYHNMAASAFEKSDFLNAYIWSKKALVLNSDNSFAQNLLNQVAKKYQPPQIPHQISTIESLQKVGLKNISFDSLLIGFLVFLLISLFLGLKLLFKAKQNQLESESQSSQKKQPLGKFVSLGFTFLFVGLFLFLTVIKWSDMTIIKAIISSDNTSVQTASGENKASIYQASAGIEVDVLKTDSQYAQIRYPGAFSGWVNKKNLEILSYPYWP